MTSSLKEQVYMFTWGKKETTKDGELRQRRERERKREKQKRVGRYGAAVRDSLSFVTSFYYWSNCFVLVIQKSKSELVVVAVTVAVAVVLVAAIHVPDSRSVLKVVLNLAQHLNH